MRTDEDIKNDIADELMWEPSVSSKEVNIEVRNGLVILSGRVDTHYKKMAVRLAAERVSGVTGVTNNIDVKISQTIERSYPEARTRDSRRKWIFLTQRTRSHEKAES